MHLPRGRGMPASEACSDRACTAYSQSAIIGLSVSIGTCLHSFLSSTSPSMTWGSSPSSLWGCILEARSLPSQAAAVGASPWAVLWGLIQIWWRLWMRECTPVHVWERRKLEREGVRVNKHVWYHDAGQIERWDEGSEGGKGWNGEKRQFDRSGTAHICMHLNKQSI